MENERRRRLEWFGHVKRRDEIENIRAVVEMKMEGKLPRGRPKLRSCLVLSYVLEGYGKEGHESMEHQGGMGH